MIKKHLLYISLVLLVSSCVKLPQSQIVLPQTFQAASNITEEEDLTEFWKKFSDTTLNQLVELAIKNNFDSKIALTALAIARGEYRTRAGVLWPKMNSSAAAIRYRVSDNIADRQFLGSSHQNYFQWGFDALWELDLFGKLRQERLATGYKIAAEEENLSHVLLMIVCETIKSYTDLRLLQKQYSLLHKHFSLQQTIATLTKNLLDAGLVNISLEARENQQLEKISQQCSKLEIALTKEKNRLAILVGTTPEQFTHDLIGIGNIPYSAHAVQVGLPSSLLKRRPDIRKAENILREKNATLAAKVAALLPSFSITTAFNVTSGFFDKWINWDSRSWYIGPIISTPIAYFGRIRGEIDVATATEQKAYLEYEQAILLALEDTENALAAYFHSQAIEASKEKELGEIEEELLIEKERYLSGLSNQITYCKMEQNQLDIERQWWEKRRDATVNLIALYKALGGGW